MIGRVAGLTLIVSGKPMEIEMSEVQYPDSGPLLDVVGVSGTHGQRCVRWLRNRSILATYDPVTKTLRAPLTKRGEAWTYEQMHAAIDATERHR